MPERGAVAWCIVAEGAVEPVAQAVPELQGDLPLEEAPPGLAGLQLREALARRGELAEQEPEVGDLEVDLRPGRDLRRQPLGP